jgi:hypothetical protein
MRSKADFDNPRLRRQPPTDLFKGEIEPGPIDGVGKSPCALCNCTEKVTVETK